MEEMKLGLVEARFADIIWNNEPLTTRELVAFCEQELNWKRTTTYTVLKKLCDRGIFVMNEKQVTSLISKEEFSSIQCDIFVKENFQGSLPAFIAAFASRNKLSDKEIAEIRRMMSELGEE